MGTRTALLGAVAAIAALLAGCTSANDAAPTSTTAAPTSITAPDPAPGDDAAADDGPAVFSELALPTGPDDGDRDAFCAVEADWQEEDYRRTSDSSQQWREDLANQQEKLGELEAARAELLAAAPTYLLDLTEAALAYDENTLTTRIANIEAERIGFEDPRWSEIEAGTTDSDDMESWAKFLFAAAEYCDAGAASEIEALLNAERAAAPAPTVSGTSDADLSAFAADLATVFAEDGPAAVFADHGTAQCVDLVSRPAIRLYLNLSARTAGDELTATVNEDGAMISVDIKYSGGADSGSTRTSFVVTTEGEDFQVTC